MHPIAPYVDLLSDKPFGLSDYTLVEDAQAFALLKNHVGYLIRFSVLATDSNTTILNIDVLGKSSIEFSERLQHSLNEAEIPSKSEMKYWTHISLKNPDRPTTEKVLSYFSSHFSFCEHSKWAINELLKIVHKQD